MSEIERIVEEPESAYAILSSLRQANLVLQKEAARLAEENKKLSSDLEHYKREALKWQGTCMKSATLTDVKGIGLVQRLQYPGEYRVNTMPGSAAHKLFDTLYEQVQTEFLKNVTPKT